MVKKSGVTMSKGRPTNKFKQLRDENILDSMGDKDDNREYVFEVEDDDTRSLQDEMGHEMLFYDEDDDIT